MSGKGEALNLRGRIRLFTTTGKIIFSNHAGERMFERDISPDDVIKLLMHGDVIEEHPERKPCPEALMLGHDISEQLCHVAVAVCRDHIKIVTVYRPAEDKWIEGRVRIRK